MSSLGEIMGQNNIEKNYTHNFARPVFSWQFIQTVADMINEYMTSLTESIYLEKLSSKLKQDNNTYTIIKLK